MAKNLDKAFTVLLPIYQRKDLMFNFDRVLHSIYNNTIIPDDLIVLIDGPLVDTFYQIIKTKKKIYNFRTLQSDKVGLSQILNKGIKKVNTKWIARMDGDDLCELDRFENSVKFMNLNYDLFGGQIREVSKNSCFALLKKVPCASQKIIKEIKYRNPFNHMTVFFKTEFAKKIGGYPDLYLKEDYAFWCKFIYHGAKVANMNKIVVTANTEGMYSRRGGIKYIVSEFKLQKILLSYNLTNIYYSFFACILRIIIYSLPVKLKLFLYNKMFRKKNDNWKRSYRKSF